MRLINIPSIVIGAVGGICARMLGGFDKLIGILTVMIAVDYVTGLLNGYMQKVLSSKVGLRGIVKKVMIYMVVVVAVVLDYLTDGTFAIREITIVFFISNECISLLENVSPYLPIPDAIKEALIQIRKGTSNDSKDIQ